MNNYMSDWNFEADLPGQKNPSGADHDLVELLWRNGQVVLHSQTQRKQQGPNIPIGEAPPPRQPHLQSAQEEETVSWIQYPMEDSFEKEFCSNFFSELPSCDPARPPAPAEVGLSHCGSNQIAVQRGPPATTGQPPSRAAPEPTATSSSGGSGSSFGRACKPCTTTSGNTNNNNKRKNRDAEELECQSEAMELDSAAGNKSSQRSGNSRKSRAAEVHNMSERRRRDRINEKMKALQELIPHSNKTDKASMLDEAIEYLKSLQLQLQVMWMGSGMTPMMFPGMQHYMSRMGMGGPMHLPPRPPAQPITVAQSADHHRQIMCQAQAQAAFNPLAYPMQSASFPEQYSRFMGFHPMQTASQPMNVFRFNHPQAVQHQQQQHQGQLMAQQGMSTRPSSGGATIDGGLIAKNMG